MRTTFRGVRLVNLTMHKGLLVYNWSNTSVWLVIIFVIVIKRGYWYCKVQVRSHLYCRISVLTIQFFVPIFPVSSPTPHISFKKHKDAVSFQRRRCLGLFILCTNNTEQQMLTMSTRESTHHLKLWFAVHTHEPVRSTAWGGGGGVGVLVKMRFISW